MRPHTITTFSLCARFAMPLEMAGAVIFPAIKAIDIQMKILASPIKVIASAKRVAKLMVVVFVQRETRRIGELFVPKDAEPLHDGLQARAYP